MIDYRKIDNCKEAINIMCSNCKNHDMCMGTGCAPKNSLLLLIKLANSFNDALLTASEILAQDMQKVETLDGDVITVLESKENWYKWLLEFDEREQMDAKSR